ncbi:Retrovirus-related Pol polyprotein from transposon TNT 1-94 [Gossypium australe]|uniref:Retrovirus-related Pol polyprotein from transposon TNT 1-94 n=1 Tax=Gossypium australe TaxID=47621 RepID=A0A5B6W773_9ROSI|nr:Retrovirus-related Pol polyprotein from transposon TNT 1-94 [Gossypium australe]
MGGCKCGCRTTTLRANPTIAQIKHHSDDCAKKFKSMSCLHNSVSNVVFTRIIACKAPKNLRMKESETAKQYSDRITVVVNNIKLLGDQFVDGKVVEKVITTLSKRPDIHYRACQQLGYIKKVCKNKMRTQEQRPKQHNAQAQTVDWNHAQEEQVFTTSCFVLRSRVVKGWLIDSGCTNHMTSEESIFRNIDKNCISKVRIGNDKLIQAKGKGDVLINTPSGTTVISDVLLVPKIDHNLLSIGQFIEKKYSVIFKYSGCNIFDSLR